MCMQVLLSTAYLAFHFRAVSWNPWNAAAALSPGEMATLPENSEKCSLFRDSGWPSADGHPLDVCVCAKRAGAMQPIRDDRR